jgi:hypothetical protein
MPRKPKSQELAVLKGPDDKYVIAILGAQRVTLGDRPAYAMGIRRDGLRQLIKVIEQAIEIDYDPAEAMEAMKQISETIQ